MGNDNHMMKTVVVALIGVILIMSSSASPGEEMAEAIQEMQRANYFTFVMLLNLAPPDLFRPGNVTFLMPNDRMLSSNRMTDNSSSSSSMVVDFLLRHSIPSPLLFDHLQYFPTGSLLPTSRPDMKLEVSNNGRRRFFLNNVRVVSPNICTRGSSIRCHGIDGLLKPSSSMGPSPCTNTSTTAPNNPLPSPPTSPPDPVPAEAMPPITPSSSSSGAQQKSSASQQMTMVLHQHHSPEGLFRIIITTGLLLLAVDSMSAC